MQSNRQIHRHADILRVYLAHLPDSNGNAIVKDDGTRQRSIEDWADDLQIDSETLRAFRDGSPSALSPPLVKAFSMLLGKPGQPMLGVSIDDTLGFADASSGGWYGSMMAEEAMRSARLRHFHLIDGTRPEAKSALDAWADLGVTGNIGDIARYNGGFEAVCFDASQAAKKVINDCSNLINFRLLPDDQKWLIFRGMVKYGDQYGELGFAPQGGRFTIDRIEPRHARTMYVHRDPQTGEYDYRKAFKQVLPGNPINVPNTFFPAYKIAHFSNPCNWGDLYGESIFNCGLRSYIQVESMEAGMIIRRLERAALRMKHFVDTGMLDGGDKEVDKYLHDYRGKHTKVRTVDSNRNSRMQKISMPVDADFIIPKRDKESPADILPVEGDGNIGKIEDFQHFFAKWLAGLGVPKAHLGYEEGTMRSVITDLHIVFARRVRRMQLKFIEGLNQIYWVQMILQGIDPRLVRFQVFPPALGTRDELIRAQVQLAHATTCRYISQAAQPTGEQPSIKWMLSKIMGMDDETLDGLEMADVLQMSPAQFKNDPPANSKESAEMAALAQTNPFVMEKIDQVQFLLEERALGKRINSESIKLPTAKRPFGNHFDDVVRSLGITRLRKVA